MAGVAKMCRLSELSRLGVFAAFPVLLYFMRGSTRTLWPSSCQSLQAVTPFDSAAFLFRRPESIGPPL